MRYDDPHGVSRESSYESVRDAQYSGTAGMYAATSMHHSSRSDVYVQSLERRARDRAEPQRSALYSSDRCYTYNPPTPAKQSVSVSNSIDLQLCAAYTHQGPSSAVYATRCESCRSAQASPVPRYGGPSGAVPRGGEWCYSCGTIISRHSPANNDLLVLALRRSSKSSASSGSSGGGAGHSPQASLTVSALPPSGRAYERPTVDDRLCAVMTSLSDNQTSRAWPSSASKPIATASKINDVPVTSSSANSRRMNGVDVTPRGTPTSWSQDKERMLRSADKGRPPIPPDYSSAVGYAAVGYAMNSSDKRMFAAAGSDSDSSSSRQYRPIKPLFLDSGSECASSSASKRTDDPMRHNPRYVSRAAEV